MRSWATNGGAAALVLVGALSACATEAQEKAPGLAADFEWDYDSTQTHGTACPFTTTFLLDRSIGAPTAWLWEFPDGSTSTEQHPVVSSDATRVLGPDGVADMAVSLTVTRDGETNTITRDVIAVHC